MESSVGYSAEAAALISDKHLLDLMIAIRLISHPLV